MESALKLVKELNYFFFFFQTYIENCFEDPNDLPELKKHRSKSFPRLKAFSNFNVSDTSTSDASTSREDSSLDETLKFPPSNHILSSLIQKSNSMDINMDQTVREQVLKDESMCLINDDQLVSLSVRQLNKIFIGLPDIVIKVLKQRRRTLKNRGYAHSCRLKRKNASETLEIQVEKLTATLKEVLAENQCLRGANKSIKKGYKEILDRLLKFEPDFKQNKQMQRLICAPDPPPALMSAYCYPDLPKPPSPFESETDSAAEQE